MIIRSDEELVGQPILKIREFFRRSQHYFSSVEHLMAHLDLEKPEAEQVLLELAEQGYIQRKNSPRWQHWVLTRKALRVAGASVKKHMTCDSQ
jgi:DNA-binding IclR family transcriptional regulator